MVNAWSEMRSIMRKRYVPASYNRDLQCIARLLKSNMSVEEYFKDMEVTMIRGKI